MTRTPLRLLVLTLTTALTALALTAPAQAAAPYCGITWGSARRRPHDAGPTPRWSTTSAPAGTPASTGWSSTSAARTPRSAPTTSGTCRTVHEDGSGDAVPVRGAADLQIIVRAPPTTSTATRPSTRRTAGGRRRDRVLDVPPGRLGRLLRGPDHPRPGVRARLPFRVFTLAGVTDPTTARGWSSTSRTAGSRAHRRGPPPVSARAGRVRPAVVVVAGAARSPAARGAACPAAARPAAAGSTSSAGVSGTATPVVGRRSSAGSA